MLSKLKALQRHLTKVANNLPKTVSLAINQNSKVLEQANREALFDGKRSDGTTIAPRYTPQTVAIKKRKGQPYNRVTLKDTGVFHKSIRVKAEPQKVFFLSKDWKTEKLKDKYQPKNEPASTILGVSRETVLRFANLYVVPKIKSEFLKR